MAPTYESPYRSRILYKFTGIQTTNNSDFKMKLKYLSFRFTPTSVLKVITIGAIAILVAMSLFTTILHYCHDDNPNSYANDVIKTRKIVPMGRHSGRAMLMVSDYDDDNGEKKKNKTNDRLGKLVINNAVYQRRIAQANKSCYKRAEGKAVRVVVDKSKTSAVCVIPKVGCTHWINIFRFINNETNGVSYDKPEDIPRWITHYGNKREELTLYTRTKPNIAYFRKTSFLGDSFRFMFVRHPIRRLWSAWVDKFLLPDFWFSEGPMVAKVLKLSVKDSLCPSNVTFNDFIRYVTNPQFARRPYTLNPHWVPYRYICDPCVFRPHLIGKMETFGHDAKIALSVMDFESYIKAKQHSDRLGNSTTDNDAQEDTLKWSDSPYSRDRSIHEMEMLTDFNLGDMFKEQSILEFFEDCGITQLFVAKRLWKAFQINGHIRQDIEFPMKHWSMNGWHQALRRAYTQWHPDQGTRKQQQSKQKDKAITIAYKRIPLTLQLKLKDLYYHDFDQFSYDFEP